MDKLPPIPTPPAQRFREFRIQVLPVVTFCAVVATIVLMWSRYVEPSNVVGAVESLHANVSSTSSGTLQELKVVRFQMVTNGQVIGQVVTVSPGLLQASIDAMKKDLDVMRARMVTDEERNFISYQGVRLSLLSDRIQHAVNRVNLRQAEADFKRAEDLFHAKPIALISQDAYDLAKTKLEALRVTVADEVKFLEDKERTLPTLRPTTTNSLSVLAAVEAEEKKIRENNQPTILTAPMDGMVTTINARPGEKVLPGVPIVIISGTQPERIVAYIRQPVQVRPKVGDTVQVRRTGFQRTSEVASITEVGTQMELVDPVLLPAANARIPETGLLIAIKVPPGLALIPGEIVNIILKPSNGQ